MKQRDYEINVTLKIIGDNNSRVFNIGDNIHCSTNDNKEYKGTIIAIGYYGDKKEPAININISDKNLPMSYSLIILRMSDIKCIYTNLFKEVDGCGEEKDKERYISYFVRLGYDRKGIEKTWKSVEIMMKNQNIPLEKLIQCVEYSLKNKCSIKLPLKQICNIDIDYIEKDLIPELEKTAFLSAQMAGEALLAYYNCCMKK